MMLDTRSVIFIVDDDESVRDALSNLLESVGIETEAFGSTEEFQNAARPQTPSCLVLDVKLPHVTGLEFQEQLAKAGMRIPIIFITGHGDIPMTRRAMKAGAVDFLTKPFQKTELLAAIRQALESDRKMRATHAELAELRARYDQLTEREREVMGFVVSGLLNKQIAARLGLKEVTVKLHRSQAMRKMRAGSLAELVRMAGKLHQ